MCVCVCVCVHLCVWLEGVTTPTFLKFVGILTKCVGKIVGKFEVFYLKKPEMQNSINI